MSILLTFQCNACKCKVQRAKMPEDWVMAYEGRLHWCAACQASFKAWQASRNPARSPRGKKP